MINAASDNTGITPQGVTPVAPNVPVGSMPAQNLAMPPMPQAVPAMPSASMMPSAPSPLLSTPGMPAPSMGMPNSVTPPVMAGGSAGSSKPGKKFFSAKAIIGLVLLIMVVAGSAFALYVSQQATQQAGVTNITPKAAGGGTPDYKGNTTGDCTIASKGCDVGAHYQNPTGCWVNHWACDDNGNFNGGGCQQYLLEQGKKSASFTSKTCGAEQIDSTLKCGINIDETACETKDRCDSVSVIWDQPCEPEPPPEPEPTPTPAVRQDYCVSSSLTTPATPNLLPGQSATLSSVTNTPVNNFWYLAYNKDNEYGPSNPKPLCVTSSGDDGGAFTAGCPAGSHQLAFKNPDTSLRTSSGNISKSYEQIFLIDTNWGNKQALRVQFNAYFTLNGGPFSLPNPACVKNVFSVTAPSPSPRPDICLSATVTTPNTPYLMPTQLATISSVSKQPANHFYYAMYNKDNLYPENGTPKPICVTSGGDFNPGNVGCPAGTYHLIFKNPSTTLRTSSGTMTRSYEQIFVNDANWGNKKVTKAQFNAYFVIGTGQWSLPQPACVQSALASVAPTPTPVILPSPTPKVSPSTSPKVSPSPTPKTTPTPVVGPMCLSITMSKTKPIMGDNVTFTCGKVTQAKWYDFRVIEPNGQIISLSATGQVSASYKITKTGKHIAQCRICLTAIGTTCDGKWEPVTIPLPSPTIGPAPKVTPKPSPIIIGPPVPAPSPSNGIIPKPTSDTKPPSITPASPGITVQDQ